MTITEASRKIEEKLESGLISSEEAARYQKLIRRTSGYGNKWSWRQQALMRADLLREW